MNSDHLTLGSLFDGSGAFPLGGILAGIEPIWSSEVDPFAVLVTHKRLPQVKHYGDVSSLKGYDLEPVDIITFGSPCFPAGTLVMTEQGYLPIDEVEVGMKVLTHKGRWKMVTAVGSKTGRTILLKGKHSSLECTPNHPIYSRVKESNTETKGEPSLSRKKEWTEAAEMLGKFWATPNKAERIKGNTRQFPGFKFSDNKEDSYYFAGYQYGKVNLTNHWRQENPLPGWVFSESEDNRRELLMGIFDSNSSQSGRNRWEIMSFSKIYIESIRLLGETLGLSTTVELYSPNLYKITIIDYYIRKYFKDSRHNWYSVREIQQAQEATIVYNLTVEEDNSYVADGIVVHNCQDLSIAGKRAGLNGARSGLFYQAIRIIKEMRKKTNGKYPRYAVYENVQGAFSSNKGEDFRTVLEAIIGVKEEGIKVPPPDNHRWAKADVLLGDGWSVAYRVLDTQYFGAPQRRSRIYLVADFAGQSAGEILFKSEGMSGYSAESFRTWQRAARGASEGSGKTVGRAVAGNPKYVINTQGSSGISITEDKTGTLIAQGHGHHPSVLHAAGFSTEHSAQSRSIGYEEEISPTLRAGVVPAAMSLEHNPSDSRLKISEKGVVQTLTERMGTGGGNVPLIAEFEQPNKEDPAPQPQAFDRYNGKVTGDVTHTLDTGAGNTIPMVFEPENKSYGISKEAYSGGEQALFNFAVNEEKSPTLQASGPGAVAKPGARAFGIGSQHSKGMLSDNPKAGYYGTEKSRTLCRERPDPTGNQGGICIVAPVETDTETYDVRFTSEGTRNARSNCYKTDTSRCLSTGMADPAANQGGIAVLEKKKAYALQGSMIGREDKNGPQGSGVNEDVCFSLNTVDKHAVMYESDKDKNTDKENLDPVHYSTSKNSHHTSAVKEQVNTLVASDYKDPPCVNDIPNDEPMYIVRRLTPVECARLQGFPDWWCSNLAIPDPSDEEMAFWKDVWDTWGKLNNPNAKPKTEKQIRKWLANPYTDMAEYRTWGNGCTLPIVYFVLSGIAWAAGKDED